MTDVWMTGFKCAITVFTYSKLPTVQFHMTLVVINDTSDLTSWSSPILKRHVRLGAICEKSLLKSIAKHLLQFSPNVTRANHQTIQCLAARTVS